MNEHKILFLPGIAPIMKAMLPAMHEIKKRNIPMDIFVFNFGESDHFQHLYDEVAEHLTDLGFKVTREIPVNQKYDIVYSAYPGCFDEIDKANQVKYYVRYKYGLTGANVPTHNNKQSVFNCYDFILCLGTPDASILSGHAKTITIGNIKLSNYKRTRTPSNDKKTILYLPTWNAKNYAVSYRVNSINTDIVNKLSEMQNRYNVMVKTHRLSHHYEDNKEQINLLNKIENVYDPNTPNDELFNQADVVLSDLSGVAFDAIAADVPLALFGLGDPVYFGGRLCLHQQLVKDDIVPGSNDVNELETIIEKALSPEYFEKQQKLKKELFPYEGRECVEAFIKFQDDLFNDRIDPWYIATRKDIRENYVREQREIQEKQEIEIKTAVESTQKAYEAEIKSQGEAYEVELKKQSENYETEIRRQSSVYENELKRKDEFYETELKKQSENYIADLKLQSENYETEIRRQNGVYEDELKRKDEFYKTELKRQNEDNEAEIKRISKNHEDELIRLREENDVKLKMQSEAYETEIRRQSGVYEDELKRKDEFYKTELKRQNEDNEAEIKRISKNHEDELIRLREENDVKLKMQSEAYETKIKEITQYYENSRSWKITKPLRKLKSIFTK